ncbi:MAG: response regulator [Rhodospirillales bacterium]|nr:response regulator [Rhodospirillales bacterium]
MADPTESERNPGSTALKVLIVDQDPLVSRIIKSKMERSGYRVHCETSGVAGLEWFKADDIRIVIVDFALEGSIDGVEFVKRLRALPRPRYTYVIFHSSRPDKDALIEALAVGADDFMMKPYNAAEFRLRLDIAQRLLDMDDELYHGGGTDKTTGVINRHAFEQFFPVVLAQAKRGQFLGALMFVRIANLREIFQRYGYEITHQVVVAVAAVLRQVHRTSDLIAKTQDNEFCLMLQNTNWDKCQPVAERILESLKPLVVPADDNIVRPQFVIESLTYPIDDLDAAAILDTAPRHGYPAGGTATAKAG